MTPFGKTAAGEDVHAVTITGHGLTVTILNYGAIVQDVRLDGVDHSLTVGSDDMADYEGAMLYHGAIVGPVANRISGAQAVINGKTYTFDANDNGRNTLHGGYSGLHQKLWQIDDIGENYVTLSLFLPDGSDGLPGNREILARVEILAGPAMRLTLTTTSDADSLINLTNHSYWTLDGAGHMNDHTLRIAADQYLPTDTATITTGEIAEVAGTDFDFRTPRPLTLGHPPTDHTFCLARERRALTDVLWLSAKSGLTMTVSTTEAGVHVYDDRPEYAAIVIEAQGWPDAPNKPQFPSVAITPDAPVIQTTQWRFSRD